MPDNSIFKDNLFGGKRVFITGGATGMGLGFAQAFLNHGAKVIIASRKEDKLTEAAAITKENFGKELLWKTMDVRDNETVEEVAKFIKSEWGGLDILINNAAGNFVAPVASMRVLGHDIDDNASIQTSVGKARKACWASFFANSAHKTCVRLPSFYKVKLVHRTVSPHVVFRCSCWLCCWFRFQPRVWLRF